MNNDIIILELQVSIKLKDDKYLYEDGIDLPLIYELLIKMQ